MAVIAKRVSRSINPLSLLAIILKNVGNRFDNVGKDIDDIYIIGDWLSIPFKYVGGKLKEGETLANQANQFLKDSIEWIYTIIEGYGFIDLIDWSSIWLKWLRTDRRLFLQQLLSYYLVEGILFLSNPKQWVLNRILGFAYWFLQFLNDPSNFIIGKILLKAAWFTLWLNNPVVRTIEWLKQYNFKLGDFLSNPTLFIINTLFFSWLWFRDFVINPTQFIVNRLKSYSPFLYSLIFDKERFIYELVRRVLGLPVTFITNPIGVLFEAILTIIEQRFFIFIDRIKNIIIKIILHFI